MFEAIFGLFDSVSSLSSSLDDYMSSYENAGFYDSEEVGEMDETIGAFLEMFGDDF